jgi:hypothetical protein
MKSIIPLGEMFPKTLMKRQVCYSKTTKKRLDSSNKEKGDKK